MERKATKIHQTIEPKKVSVTSANGGEGGNALGFLEHFSRHLVDFGSQFWRPLDLRGSICLSFPDVFGAAAKHRKNNHLLTIIQQKSEKPNASRNVERMDPLVFCWLPFWRQLDFGGPIRLVFLDVLVFGDIENKLKIFVF